MVCNTGALLSSFPCSSGGPLVGLRIGCGVTEASSFHKVILSDPVLVVRESFNDLACCIPPTIVQAERENPKVQVHYPALPWKVAQSF